MIPATVNKAIVRRFYEKVFERQSIDAIDELIQPEFIDRNLTPSASRDPESPEFGIKLAWEYQLKAESGQMNWFVDAAQPGLVFTNKSVQADSLPAIYDYQMVGDRMLITATGELEERTVLEGDWQRLRELRCDGALVRRHWEHKFNP